MNISVFSKKNVCNIKTWSSVLSLFSINFQNFSQILQLKFNFIPIMLQLHTLNISQASSILSDFHRAT